MDWLTMLRYHYGNLIWVLPLAASIPLLWRSKRMRLPAVLVMVMGTVSLVEVWWYPHYAAPFLAVLLILAAQSLRYLRQWKYHGREVGRSLVNAIPAAVLLVMMTFEAQAIARHQTTDQIQSKNTQVAQKDNIERELLKNHSGQHVILVSYAGLPRPHEEWIYNPANIDAAPVIWALDLGQTENEKLRRHYAGRSFWLFKPAELMSLIPY